MTVLLGPMPCVSCRALVVFTDIGGERLMMTRATQRQHTCERPPRESSYRDLVKWYGEDEALVRWGGLRAAPDETERARKRRYMARRRAAA